MTRKKAAREWQVMLHPDGYIYMCVHDDLFHYRVLQVTRKHIPNEKTLIVREVLAKARKRKGKK